MLDEDIWKKLNVIDDFKQVDPNFNTSPSKETEVKIFYNDNSIFFGVKIYDDINQISGNLAQYDDWFEGFENSSDYFIVEIDSYHDHQTSFAFAVNSVGVRADYMIYNDNPEMIDDDWNQKWEAKVQKTEEGWNIEYEIPFKALKFNNTDNIGINFIRYIKRNNEYHSWVVLPRETEGVVSHYGHLVGMEIEKNKYLSFRPYLLFGSTKYNDYYYKNIELMNEFNIINKSNYEKLIGLDLAYNINNFSTFSITMNPDFGQIEQDPSEINLTGYETYFEEKRPFFIESSNIFNTPINIFYSRRVGGDVKLNYNSLDTLLNYRTDLNLALKLTGKSNNGISYGLIAAESEIDSSKSIFDENKIHTSTFRLAKDLFDGNSYFGFMDVYYDDGFSKSNIISFDGLFNFYNNKLNLDAQIINSYNKKESIESFDGNGVSMEISFKDKIENKFNFLNNKIFETWLNLEVFDDDLEIYNTGYLYRNDLKKIDFGISIFHENYNQISNEYFSPNPSVKNYLLFFKSTIAQKRNDDLRLTNTVSLNWKSTFNNYWFLNLGLISGLEYFDDRLYDYYLDQIQSSLIVKKPKYKKFYLSFGSNPTKNYSFNASLNLFKNKFNDKGFSYTISSIIRPFTWFNLDMSYNIDLNNEKYHFLKVRKLSNSGIREEEILYQFTKSNNLEKYISSRASVFFNDKISLQLYLEYYKNKNNVSEDVDDLSILRQENNLSYPIYSNALTLDENYNILYRTNYSSFTSNIVFKWEYNPSSILYVVYSIYKDVSGINFENFVDLINYEFNESDNAEIFFDKSFYIKIDYWFDL